jgi:hypothetical protein
VFGSKLFIDCSLTEADRLAPTVSDVKDVHGLAFDGEQDAVDVGSPTVEKLSKFKVSLGFLEPLGSARAASRGRLSPR